MEREDYLKLVEKRRLGLPDEMVLHLRAFEGVLYHIRSTLPPG
jgi:hypothetical protein